MLGGLGGAFVSLDIIVDEADAEDAVELLRDIREGDHAASDDDAADDPDPASDDADRDADADGVWASRGEPRDAPLPFASSVVTVSDRRRRIAIALLLAATLGFGTAHMFTRRGFGHGHASGNRWPNAPATLPYHSGGSPLPEDQ
jgi:hypothetical protein